MLSKLNCPGLMMNSVFVAFLFVWTGCGSDAHDQLSNLDTVDRSLSSEASESQSAPSGTAIDKTRRHRLDKSTDFALYKPHGKAHWPGDEDDPRMVRETGFQPIQEDDDDPRYVRETGFLPSPRIRLDRLDGQLATVRWNRVEGAGHYVLNGIRFGVEGEPAESFDLRVDGVQVQVNTEGRITQVMVVAVSEDGSARSRPSNKLSINPEFD